MDQRDKLAQIVKMKGPLLPSEVNKAIGTNTLFASAMLSELVDKKVLKLSHVKVGGSPVYYAPGQESKLQTYYDRLHEKEKKAYDRLKLQKVLRDIDQEPVVRVALRELKDFAVPLDVNLNGTQDLFWKWFLVQDSEAEALIKQFLGVADESVEDEEPSEEGAPVPETPIETKRVEKQITTPEPRLKKELTKELKEDIRAELKKELQSELKQHIKSITEQEQRTLTSEPAKPAKEPKKRGKIKQETKVPVPEKKAFPKGDDFFDEIKYFFKKNHVDIIKFTVIRKNSDIEFIVEIPSNVGSLRYFCKARSKTRINDADLSSVYVKGQMEKLPVLLITTGDLTKKAKEMLTTECKNVTVKKI